MSIRLTGCQPAGPVIPERANNADNHHLNRKRGQDDAKDARDGRVPI